MEIRVRGDISVDTGDISVDTGDISVDISVDTGDIYRRYIADIGRYIGQNVYIYFFSFFCFFPRTVFCYQNLSYISVIYRYIGDISLILSYFFRLFQ